MIDMLMMRMVSLLCFFFLCMCLNFYSFFTAYLSAGICFLNSTTHDEVLEILMPLGLFGMYHRGCSGWPL